MSSARTKKYIKGVVTDTTFLLNLKKGIKIFDAIDVHLTVLQTNCALVSEEFQTFVELPRTFSAIVILAKKEKEYLVKASKECMDFICRDAHTYGNLLDPRYLGDA